MTESGEHEFETAAAGNGHVVAGSVESSERRADEVERLREELEAERERGLRTLAEFDNYRRRVRRERAHAGREGRRDILLALLDVMVRSGKPLSELAAAMEVYPQTLINVRVEEPGAAKAVAASEAVRLAVSEAESTLGEDGRVLLRPSGTEPVVRVMVEHTDERVCREVCEEISRAVDDAGKEGT